MIESLRTVVLEESQYGFPLASLPLFQHTEYLYAVFHVLYSHVIYTESRNSLVSKTMSICLDCTTMSAKSQIVNINIISATFFEGTAESSELTIMR
ncbi:hypothetical protein TNCV_4074301 [Trichonephila clavipes]|uniref:Uncharacterized protein n=1 Tax=Trichonephila clavipes TaxID=2585209 RepID=A0A8X6W8U9_TRICX|nr:hypothetical protein TNCV_4074301 [Trichonephila clavipes]